VLNHQDTLLFVMVGVEHLKVVLVVVKKVFVQPRQMVVEWDVTVVDSYYYLEEKLHWGALPHSTLYRIPNYCLLYLSHSQCRL
jgi:hypothetical protein